MKIKNIFAGLHIAFCLTIFLSSSVFSAVIMEKEQETSHQSLKEIVEGHIKKNPGILTSSHGKDIVVVLGNTGSGKSTILNYLSGKKLKVNDAFEIELEDPNDPSAMAIGLGVQSETFLPQSIQVEEFLFYDLPGFKDTKGTATNLANAAFIKSIIENANSAKLVFIVGIDQITADRGNSFINLLNQVKELVPGETIEAFSSLIITKSHLPKERLSKFITAKLALQSTQDKSLLILKDWIENERVDQMSTPIDFSIDDEEKINLLNLIRETHSKPIKNIDIGVIYALEEQRHIQDIYEVEIDDLFKRLVEEHFSISLFSSGNTIELKDKSYYLKNDFKKELQSAYNALPLISLLRPISEHLYKSAWRSKKSIVKVQIDNIFRQIEQKIIEKEKEEEKERRIQAEKSLKETQDNLKKAEDILREYQELERKRQLDVLKRQETDSEYQYNLGDMHYYGNGTSINKLQAFEWYRKAAFQGHAAAQTSLALMYDNGEGVELDKLKAFKWYKKAAVQGYVEAQYKLGMMYKSGHGIPINILKAFEWVRKAAVQGYAKAQNRLGIMYFKGDGVSINERKAFNWVEKSALQGYVAAQNNLGNMYYNGNCVPINKLEAFKWYKTAAIQDKTIAQYNLAKMYYSGDGVSINKLKAFKWYEKAALQGYAEAQNRLGVMYREGYGTPVDKIKAFEWFEKAAFQNNAEAQFRVGYMYKKGDGIVINNSKAVKWYKKSALQSYALAQNNLGSMYKHGYGIPVNKSKAVEWYIKAALQGNVRAHFNLGRMYRDGDGVPVNTQEAVKYFKKAVEGYKKSALRGRSSSQHTLGKMYRDGDGVPVSKIEAIKWFEKAALQDHKKAQISLNNLK